MHPVESPLLLAPIMIPFRRYCVYELVMSKDLEGDVIELGLGTGRNAFHLARVVKDLGLNKKVYSCDTFGGLPYTDEGSGIKNRLMKGGWYYLTLAQFKLEAMKEALTDILIPIVGLVEETLPKQLSDKQFCFAWLDLDLYKPTVYGYKFLEERMTKGGIVGFHDYGNEMCPGIKKVVDETLDRNKFQQVFRGGSSIFFKRI